MTVTLADVELFGISSMGEVPAGKFVIREWRKVNLELETKLKALIVFIGENYLGD